MSEDCIDEGVAGLSLRATELLTSLPSVAVSCILSELNWIDKLHAVEAIPLWHLHLFTTDAWPCLQYVEDQECIHSRKTLTDCLDTYGRYIINIQMEFYSSLAEMLSEIFLAMADSCSQLKILHMSNCVWTPYATQAFAQVLNKCSSLSSVFFIRPSLSWEETLPKENILMLMSSSRHAPKVKELLLYPDCLLHGIQDLLPGFKSMVRLKLQRDELQEHVLLELATNASLTELTTFQEEELLNDDAMAFNEETWHEIITQKPSFVYNLLMKNVIVLKVSFPSFAPIRSLVLIDLATPLTKGILDTICARYKNSLEVFVYTQQHNIQTSEMEDRRLPVALVSLVSQCSHLHTLVYGFDISVSTVLLLAEARKLSSLVIGEDNICYVQDWAIDPAWSYSFTQWLHYAGRSIDSLKTEVSALLGYNWEAMSSTAMWLQATDYWYM